MSAPPSAPASASRRTGLGSSWFDYCRLIELNYVPMDTGHMVPMHRTKGYSSAKSPTEGLRSTKSPDRHSRSTNAPPTPHCRRTLAPPSNRDPYDSASVSSSNSGPCKGSNCSPTKGRHQKYTSHTDNHGIRPPPPEQYLTPLQQKEVCIRHLRARLKETISTLQDRDTEIDELRGQLYRMQEDWVEEECHRVEAQLVLKEARKEIQQLKQAVDTVRARLNNTGGISGDVGVQKYIQDINTQNHKLGNLLLNMELAQAGSAKEEEVIIGCQTRAGGSAPASVSGESPGGIPKPSVGGTGSCSCDGSPAHCLNRSSTYTKLSDQVLGDQNGNGPEFPYLSADGTQDSGFVCCGGSSIPSQADLLLEAAFLSEETASLLNSYTKTFSHSLSSSLPNCLPQTFSRTLPHSLSHSPSKSVSHTLPNSSSYEKVCTSERLMPFHCSLGGRGCVSHPCLSHHHLYLHPLQETGIQTESCPIPETAVYPSNLDTIAEQRTFRSQACSPTSTWISDDGEGELDSITATTSVTTVTVLSTATEPTLVSKTSLVPPLQRSVSVVCSLESPLCRASEEVGELEKQERENRRNFRGEETKTIRLTEEGQQTQVSSIGGHESAVQGKVEGAAPRKCIEGMQGDLISGGCCGGDKLARSTLESFSMDDGQEEASHSAGSTQVEAAELSPSLPGLSSDVEQPHTSQPRRSNSLEEIPGVTVVEVHDENDDEDEAKEEGALGGAPADEEDLSGSGKIQKNYWNRLFLVDLLAVAIPVVPMVAWLCRGPVRGGQPMYHIRSLLHGCCTVALHSLRRGSGLRHYPAGGGDLGGSLI